MSSGHVPHGAEVATSSQLLAGVRVCVTGFEPEDREDIRKLVQQFGGAYDAELAKHACTHLLAAEGAHDTAKYAAAKRWGNIAIVPFAWLQRCVEEKGACLRVCLRRRAAFLHGFCF